MEISRTDADDWCDNSFSFRNIFDRGDRMEKKIVCPECESGEITQRVTDYPYIGTELPRVVLLGVTVESCDNCEEGGGVLIPGIESLHRALAHGIATSTRKLEPGDIRFLRKSLGWSGKDFAGHVGVDPSTVSRWENGAKPIGSAAERFLRLAAVQLAPVDEYPLPDVMDGPPGPWTLESSPSGEWEVCNA